MEQKFIADQVAGSKNMPEKWCSLILGLAVLSLAPVMSSGANEVFTSSFLVRFKRSVENRDAHDIAKRNSFHNIGPVSFYLSCYAFLINSLTVDVFILRTLLTKLVFFREL